jgi:hypothetical protein
MDFNSIFSRGDGGNLEGRLPDLPPSLEAWDKFLTTVYPLGRTPYTIEQARELHQSVRDKQARFSERIQSAARTSGMIVEHQLWLLGYHAVSELLSEIEKFNASGVAHADDPESEKAVHDSDVFSDLVHVDIGRDHHKVMLLYRSLHSISIELLRKNIDRRRKEQLSQGVYELYKDFKRMQDGTSSAYGVLKREAKAALPKRAHYLVDKVIALFIEEPIEAGILLIRRNFPGAIGAFQGLEEETE